MLDRLLGEHRRIEALADVITAALEPPAPDVDRLRDARWELAKAMMQHLAYEDRHLYLPLERDARPAVANVALRFKAELGQSQPAYEEHTARWTATAITADWEGFRAASRHQLAFLRDRLRREELELFPLAAFLDDGRATPDARHNWARTAWTVREALDEA